MTYFHYEELKAFLTVQETAKILSVSVSTVYRMIESGASWKYTQYSLGHSEIQTTMDIYVSVSEEFQQKENESFEEYMKSAFTKDTSKNEPSNVIITKLA